MKTRKQIRKDRRWNEFVLHLPRPMFDHDGNRLQSYDANAWRNAFERFQEDGAASLTPDELRGIHPLVCAQKNKEIMLTSLAEESMEWWAKGWGWIHPWQAVLDGKPSRLLRLAILRTIKTISTDPHGFFERHPGISDGVRNRYFAQRESLLTNMMART